MWSGSLRCRRRSACGADVYKRQVEERGTLRFATVGGIDPRVLQSKRVLIGEKRVPGVIGSMAIHLLQAKDKMCIRDSQRAARYRVAGQIDDRSPIGNHIPHLHQLAHTVSRQAQIHIKLLQGNHLLPLGRRGHMRCV